MKKLLLSLTTLLGVLPISMVSNGNYFNNDINKISNLELQQNIKKDYNRSRISSLDKVSLTDIKPKDVFYKLVI